MTSTKCFGNLRILEEEDPMLQIVWNEENGEIDVQNLWAQIQIEILKSLMRRAIWYSGDN